MRTRTFLPIILAALIQLGWQQCYAEDAPAAQSAAVNAADIAASINQENGQVANTNTQPSTSDATGQPQSGDAPQSSVNVTGISEGINATPSLQEAVKTQEAEAAEAQRLKDEASRNSSFLFWGFIFAGVLSGISTLIIDKKNDAKFKEPDFVMVKGITLVTQKLLVITYALPFVLPFVGMLIFLAMRKRYVIDRNRNVLIVQSGPMRKEVSVNDILGVSQWMKRETTFHENGDRTDFHTHTLNISTNEGTIVARFSKASSCDQLEAMIQSAMHSA